MPTFWVKTISQPEYKHENDGEPAKPYQASDAEEAVLKHLIATKHRATTNQSYGVYKRNPLPDRKTTSWGKETTPILTKNAREIELLKRTMPSYRLTR